MGIDLHHPNCTALPSLCDGRLEWDALHLPFYLRSPKLQVLDAAYKITILNPGFGMSALPCQRIQFLRLDCYDLFPQHRENLELGPGCKG